MHDDLPHIENFKVPDGPSDRDPLPQYHVYLHNDEIHDQFFVMTVLEQWFGYDRTTAYEKMMGVHVLGKSLVATAHQELAEHYVQILQHRCVDRMGRGLIASMEPAQ